MTSSNGALMLSLISAWTNCRVNIRDAGDLRHHCAHYDVTVMSFHQIHNWRDDIETLSVLLSLCEGNPSPLDSYLKEPAMRKGFSCHDVLVVAALLPCSIMRDHVIWLSLLDIPCSQPEFGWLWVWYDGVIFGRILNVELWNRKQKCSNEIWQTSRTYILVLVAEISR